MTFNAYMADMVRTELEDIVGQEHVSTKKGEALVYGVDSFWLGRMWVDRGMQPLQPDFIVRPDSAEQISRVLKVANYYKIPVQTWGGGSGSQGGATPVAGGIVLDTKRMNRLIEIDEYSMSITAETGIIFQTLENYANEKGYSLMHYPSCLTCCTVGGALAHRGTGILSSKYGKIDDMCLSMEVVLPNGDIINSLPVPKHAVGPDLNQIFIGSEGTLGVMSKVTLKLFAMPEVRRHRGFLFKDMHDGIKAGRDIMQKFKPSVMRLYDEPETRSIIKKVVGFDKQGAFMNITYEGVREIVDVEERIMLDICAKYNAEDLGNEWGEKWFKNRITFFYPGNIMDIPQMFGTMDTISSYANVEKLYWAKKNAVESFENVRYIAHCSHWYDWGTMIYDRFIMDEPPEDIAETISLHNKIWNAAVRAGLENGGVLNHHHGVGLKLGRLMKDQFGPAMQVFETLKKGLDPNGIMNPYKMGI